MGSSLVVGLGSEYYVNRKNFSWVRASIYCFATYGGFVAVSTQLLRTGLAAGGTLAAKKAAAPETWQDVRQWVRTELNLMFNSETGSAPEASTKPDPDPWEEEPWMEESSKDERDYAEELRRQQFEEHDDGLGGYVDLDG